MNNQSYFDKKSLKHHVVHEAIERIQNALLPVCGKKNVYSARKKINYMTEGEMSIYILAHGQIEICRSSNHISIEDVFAPSIIGIVNAHANFYELDFYNNEDSAYYAMTLTECVFYTCSLRDFVSIIDKENLWHDIARILASIIHTLTKREKMLAGTDAYKKIKYLLIELSRYPDDVRRKKNIQSFIHNRSGLSKSRIMKIISSLKDGGYIDTLYGRLVSIKKRLPESF